MDVRAENRGRPHPKVRFSAAPVMGRNFLTHGRAGVRVRNVCGKSGPKSLCLCCFFFPDFKPLRFQIVSGLDLKSPVIWASGVLTKMIQHRGQGRSKGRPDFHSHGLRAIGSSHSDCRKVICAPAFTTLHSLSCLEDTPRRSHSPTGRSMHLLETPLLRTPSKNL